MYDLLWKCYEEAEGVVLSMLLGGLPFELCSEMGTSRVVTGIKSACWSGWSTNSDVEMSGL